MYEDWNEKESSVVAILCFFDKEVLLFYILSSFSLYIIRYMLICKNNSKFAYKLLSADGVYVNN